MVDSAVLLVAVSASSVTVACTGGGTVELSDGWRFWTEELLGLGAVVVCGGTFVGGIWPGGILVGGMPAGTGCG